MNAIDLLKNDHDYVDMLFGRIEDTPPSRHAAVFKQLKGELETHAHIEETIFYREAKEKGSKDLKDIVMESLEEHAQIKMFLDEISRSRSTDKREAKLKVLIEDTRHHVKEEESEMFPLIEDTFSSDQLEKLGKRMEREKVKFQEANGIPQRREEPQGAFTKVVEKAKAVIESMIGGSSDENEKTTKTNGPQRKQKVITAPNAKRIGQVRSVNADGGSKTENGSSKKKASSSKPKRSKSSPLRKRSASDASATR